MYIKKRCTIILLLTTLCLISIASNNQEKPNNGKEVFEIIKEYIKTNKQCARTSQYKNNQEVKNKNPSQSTLIDDSEEKNIINVKD